MKGTWDSEFSQNYSGYLNPSYYTNTTSYNGSVSYNYQNYSSNKINVCVTVLDLQNFGYIDQNNPVSNNNYQPWRRVTPENFCYEFVRKSH